MERRLEKTRSWNRCSVASSNSSARSKSLESGVMLCRLNHELFPEPGRPMAIQALALLAKVKTRVHRHRNTPAAMELEQIRLCLFPEVCRGASCARASICACLACNTVNALGATLRTKPDSQRLAVGHGELATQN